MAIALNYQAVNSCLMLLPQLDGASVLTVEGLAAADGTLHPVQQALIDADATQCGFCTPGFAMAMFAFHHGGEGAEDARIHEALAGNLCRCTGYRSIVDACRRIAAGPSDRFATAGEHSAAAVAELPTCTDYRHHEQIYLAPTHPRRAAGCRRAPSRRADLWPAAPISGCGSARTARRFRA